MSSNPNHDPATSGSDKSAGSSQTSEHSTATVGDVRGVIATDMTAEQIKSFLEDAWFTIKRKVGYGSLSKPHAERLEKYYAAYLIRSFYDRALDNASRPSVGLDYEGSALENLKNKVDSLDPSDDLIPDDDSNVIRRKVSSINATRPHSKDGIGDDGPD